MRPSLLLLLWGCADPGVLPPRPAPGTLTLTGPTGPFVGGDTRTLSVGRADPFENVALWASRTTGAPVACPPRLADCLALSRPITFAGQDRTRGAGTANLTVTFPDLPRDEVLHFQAGTDDATSSVLDVRVLSPRLDHDGDGLRSGEERALGTDPRDADSDGDRLTDGEEVALGTDPTRNDTDADRIRDGRETQLGLDPLADDTDGDGLRDGDELDFGTDPLVVDSDGDGTADGLEVDDDTDPLDPLDPWPVTDSGAPTPAELCPPGEVPACWGACVPDTRGDDVCDRAFDCPRYSDDRLDCAVDPTPPSVCASNEVVGCFGGCRVPTDGDGTCEVDAQCPRADWDGDDCPGGGGPTLRAFVAVNEPGDLAQLAGIAHLDGALHLRLSGSVDLPDLRSVTDLVVDGPSEVRLPALVSVDGAVDLAGPLQRVELPALAGVRDTLRIAATELGPTTLPIRRLGGALEVVAGPASLTLPALTDGNTLTLTSPELAHLSAPALTRVAGVLFSGGLQSVDLPLLVEIDTSLRAVDATDLDLDLPALAHVGFNVDLRNSLTRLSLPALPSAGRLQVSTDTLRAVELDALTTLADLQWTTTGLATLSMPSLVETGATRIRSYGLEVLDLPALEDFGRLNGLSSPELVSLDLSSLPQTPSQFWRGGFFLGTDAPLDLRLGAPFVRDLTLPNAGRIELPNATGASRLNLAGDDLQVVAPLLRDVDELTLHLTNPLTLDLDDVGILRLTADGAGRLSLPALVDPHAGRMANPNVPIRRDDPHFQISGTAAVRLHAPALTRVAALRLVDSFAVDLPSLAETWSIRLTCTDASTPQTLSLPALTRAYEITAGDWLPDRPWVFRTDRSCVEGLDLPALTHVGGLRMPDSPALRDVRLPALTDAETLELQDIDALQTVDLSALERLGADVAAPALLGLPYAADRRVPPTGLWMRRVAGAYPLSLPALDAAETLELTENTGLLDLHAPLLRALGTLRLSEQAPTRWGDVTTVGTAPTFDLVLPSLERVDALFVLHDRRLARLDLPALTELGTWVRALDAPALTRLTAPALRHTTGWVDAVHAPHLRAVDLAQLETVGRLAWSQTGLSAVDTPRLRIAEDDVSAWENASLSRWSLPALERARGLYFVDNPVLRTLEVPALQRVVDVTLLDLPSLAVCTVLPPTAQVAQLERDTCTP
jgi:hypothetical protein